MAVIRNLVVKIGADIGNLVKGLKSAQQQLDKVSKKMAKVGASLTATFTVPFTAFATMAVKSSAEIEESMLAVEKSFNATGKEISELLHKANITTNKNSIPNEPLSPTVTSGLRLGTPAVTTIGMKEDEMKLIASFIYRIVKDKQKAVKEVKKEVLELMKKFR